MPSWVTELVAGLGLALAITSLLWQWWSYRDARRERVGAELFWSTSTESPLYVDIWNAGRVAVFVTSVELAWGDEGQGIVRVAFQAHPPLKGALQVGQEHRFILTTSPKLLEQAKAQPAEKIWVSVTAPRGEIHRISGSEVLPYLRLLAPAPDAGQQTSTAGPG